MRALKFITGHMVYNLAYTYLNFTDDSHPKQPQGFENKIMALLFMINLCQN